MIHEQGLTSERPLVRIQVQDFQTRELVQEVEAEDYPTPGTAWTVDSAERRVVGIEFLSDDCKECLCVRIWVR